MDLLLIEARLTSFNRLKYGEVTLHFKSLGEVSQPDFANIDQYFQKDGNLAFKLGEIDPTDLPDKTTKIKGQISPSEYLRTRLFAKHMAMGGTKENFPGYYERAVYGFAQAVDDSYKDKND